MISNIAYKSISIPDDKLVYHQDLVSTSTTYQTTGREKKQEKKKEEEKEKMSIKQWKTPLEGIDSLQLTETPMPTPGTDEVLVEIHAVSLNYRDVEGMSHSPTR